MASQRFTQSRTWIRWGIGINIVLIALMLHRESWYVRTFNVLQTHERQLAALMTQKQKLIHLRAQKQSRTALLAEARSLGYVPLNLKQVHPIP